MSGLQEAGMNFCPRCAAPLRPRSMEGRERLACSADSCDYVFYDNPAPVVAALLEPAGEMVSAGALVPAGASLFSFSWSQREESKHPEGAPELNPGVERSGTPGLYSFLPSALSLTVPQEEPPSQARS